MLELCEVIKERNNVVTSAQTGGEVNLTNLRECCKRFNNRCVVNPVFKTDGTDQELWESVNTYFTQFLKKA